jgi:chemotaxis protein methyltransferase CheR
MELKQEERVFLQDFVKKACGLVIPDDKEYLFKFRLAPVMEGQGFSSFEELCRVLKSGDRDLEEKVITELTTHETFFFRDKHPFEAFKSSILPWLEKNIVERKNKSFVRKGAKAGIWCAAASTGQEPYSLAMLIDEYARGSSSLDREDISILATDVSSKVLAQAMEGSYLKFEVERGLPEAFRERYFKARGSRFEIAEDIRKMVDFRFSNLTEDFEQLGGFDVIFSRNVLIYFDEETKKKIISRFHKMLSPGGFLILGASENIYGISELFKTQQSGATLLYRKS